MAPEVFRHEKYDKSVDVFSFAIILQEVSLSGKEGSQVSGFSCSRVSDRARLVLLASNLLLRRKFERSTVCGNGSTED